MQQILGKSKAEINSRVAVGQCSIADMQTHGSFLTIGTAGT
jgi:hypothetical protein